MCAGRKANRAPRRLVSGARAACERAPAPASGLLRGARRLQSHDGLCNPLPAAASCFADSPSPPAAVEAPSLPACQPGAGTIPGLILYNSAGFLAAGAGLDDDSSFEGSDLLVGSDSECRGGSSAASDREFFDAALCGGGDDEAGGRDLPPLPWEDALGADLGGGEWGEDADGCAAALLERLWRDSDKAAAA